jgi:hypothetical protein
MSKPEDINGGSAPEGEFVDTLKLSNIDGLVMEDMRRHAAINRAPLSKAARYGAKVAERTGDLARTEQENVALQARVEELEQALRTASGPVRQADTEFDVGAWTAKDYEGLLQEKSAIIRTLQEQILVLELGSGKGNREQCGSRADDQQALVLLMRQMHRSMSKDQAEIARQRDEIERLHRELRRQAKQSGAN